MTSSGASDTARAGTAAGRKSSPSVGGLWTRGRVLVLGGCALFGLSIVLPVMRWGESAAHPTTGSARVSVGAGFTLADGGFAGTDLLPVSIVAVAVLAAAVLCSHLGGWTWWVQLAAAGIALYYPCWVLYVFAKKWEDDVYPAEGALVLVAAFACIVAGLWLSRPGRPRRTSG